MLITFGVFVEPPFPRGLRLWGSRDGDRVHDSRRGRRRHRAGPLLQVRVQQQVQGAGAAA